ncbi:MAG: hypothetical protein HYY57_05215 [Candidatus Omnitrophica bacterium]|nr:hypothetical protein [Candidatus Omnitrophota bacterium]
MSLLNVTLRKNKLTPPPSALPSSFRDPDGHVFLRDDILYRQINHCHRVHYDHLMTSGLYEALTERGWLIPHTEVSLPRHGLVEAYRILKPERVPYISYAYEWCFSQLKQAALTVLAIQRLALAYDMTLKDACTTNVQFAQPVAALLSARHPVKPCLQPFADAHEAELVLAAALAFACTDAEPILGSSSVGRRSVASNE